MDELFFLRLGVLVLPEHNEVLVFDVDVYGGLSIFFRCREYVPVVRWDESGHCHVAFVIVFHVHFQIVDFCTAAVA